MATAAAASPSGMTPDERPQETTAASPSAPETATPSSQDPCSRNGGEVNGVKEKSEQPAQAAEPSKKEVKEEEEEEKKEEEPALPALSPADFRVYNRMAEHMDMFHEHFRQSWNLLWDACEAGRRPAGTSLRVFVGEGLDLVRYLTAHHNIEEAHIFPVLARRMPEFRKGGAGGAAELLRQHRAIHHGMDVLEAYLRAVRNGDLELDLAVLKTKMESWRDVLWTHLDQEVKTLGAENMRKYWSLAEMRRMPM